MKIRSDGQLNWAARFIVAYDRSYRPLRAWDETTQTFGLSQEGVRFLPIVRLGYLAYKAYQPLGSHKLVRHLALHHSRKN
jgi:hypothetical protein